MLMIPKNSKALTSKCKYLVKYYRIKETMGILANKTAQEQNWGWELYECMGNRHLIGWIKGIIHYGFQRVR